MTLVLTGCASSSGGETRSAKEAQTATEYQQPNDLMDRTRLISGDYFLHRETKPEPVRIFERKEGTSAEADEELERELTQIKQRLSEVERGDSGAAEQGRNDRPADSPTSASAEPLSYAEANERLKTLKKLYQDGLITDEEYQQKRQGIVDRL